MASLRIDRRELLRQASLLAAAVAAGCRRREEPQAAPPPAAAPSVPPAPEPVRLSSLQREALDAATARILPADELPGAREVGVIEFLDRELGKPQFAELRTSILAGLVALDRVSQRAHGGKRFVQLEATQQDDVLAKVQSGSARGADFLGLLVTLTLEGYLGDPSHGGNRGGAGWKLSGYSPLHRHVPGGHVAGGHDHE